MPTLKMPTKASKSNISEGLLQYPLIPQCLLQFAKSD